MKIGIFGGTFNPPHLGHFITLQEVSQKLGLDRIYIVPAAQNPLKIPIEGAAPEARLEMLKLTLPSWGSTFLIDDVEIIRGGKSYTIDTIRYFQEKFKNDELFLIMGIDQFENFNSWKDFEEILKKIDLVVTSRPHFELPNSVENLPEFIKKYVSQFEFNILELNLSSHHIQFIKTKEIDISSSELRRWIRQGKNVEKYLPIAIENFIKESKAYPPLASKILDYEKFTRFCAQILFNKKGIQVKGFDLRKMNQPSEFSLITSGTSTRHTAALAENLIEVVKTEFQVYPQGIEGLDEGRWVIVDYGSLIVHIFYDFVRQEYGLERLWKEGLDLQVSDESIKISEPNLKHEP